MTSLVYSIAAPIPASHEVRVSIEVPAELSRQSLTLRLPAWIPGSYMVRDYARHVLDLSASSGGRLIAVEKTDKSTWTIPASPEAVRVELTVYAWDLSVRGAHVDQTHVYFNGACVFPEILQHQGAIQLDIEPIPDIPDQAWVATSMRAIAVDARGFGRYEVADYDELIDHPFEIAEQTNIPVDVNGIAHRLIIRGAMDFDQEQLAKDCQKIFETHHRLMGTPEDLDRYDVLAYAEVDGYGGLEHRWSTSLAVSLRDLPQRVAGQTDRAAYRKLLGLISHEYFHLWNVRRLKPQAFEPMDLTGEVHTRLLWVFEGITSYFDDLGLVRSQVVSLDEYLNLIAQNLTRVLRTPGRHRQSLAESSFEAWTKFYKQDENAPNAIVSYYAKGAAVALALDLELRGRSATSLDQVMQACWQRFYVEGNGMPERGLESVAAELSGLDLTRWFDRHVRGTEDPDFDALFARFGIEWFVRPANGPNDLGGATRSVHAAAFTGLRLLKAQTRIAAVLSDSPALRAGLSAGDEIVAIDGLKATPASVERLQTHAQPNEAVALHVFRRGRLFECSLVPGDPVNDTVTLRLSESTDAPMRQRLDSWLWRAEDV